MLSKITSEKRDEKFRSELVQIELALKKSLNQQATTEEHKAIKRNSKYFFTYVKKLSKVKSKVVPLTKENEELTADSKEMADLLAKQYSQVFSTPDESPVDPQTPFADDKTWKLKNIKFSVEDLIEESNTIKSHASSGPDGFPIILVQKCPALAYPLYKFWTKCWEDEISVQSLKEPVFGFNGCDSRFERCHTNHETEKPCSCFLQVMLHSPLKVFQSQQ